MSCLQVRFSLRRSEFVLQAEFTVPSRGITALFGPSGSGKTTVLRCVAGLEHAAGHCSINHEVWQNDTNRIFLPTHRRPIGYVFQDTSLFPHLSVRQNLEYGWKLVALGQRRVHFDDTVELLGIGTLLARKPGNLSGGERQRVAIARALLTSPRLLLMDEPLSALDQTSKGDILPYLERLHSELAIPVLYVSHAPDEVTRLADTMVLMQRGQIQAVGALRDLLVRLDLPLAYDDRASAVVDATVEKYDDYYRLAVLEFDGCHLLVPHVDILKCTQVRLRIYARDVSLTLQQHHDSSILNSLPARVIELQAAGSAQVLVRLCIGTSADTPLLARITRKSSDALRVQPGMNIFAQIKSVAVAS